MKKYDKIMIASGDIISCFIAAKSIGWDGMSELSLNRIIYFAAVLFKFRFSEKKNIFEDDYEFSITLRGPEAPIIKNAITHLQTNFIISSRNSEYFLDIEDEAFTKNLPYYEEKKSWIEDIVYLMGVYGEEKLYDFIFRDPEYKANLKSKSSKLLDLSEDNYTIKYLNMFKKDFESSISQQSPKLANKQYLELYFEYVFSKILKGESVDG